VYEHSPPSSAEVKTGVIALPFIYVVLASYQQAKRHNIIHMFWKPNHNYRCAISLLSCPCFIITNLFSYFMRYENSGLGYLPLDDYVSFQFILFFPLLQMPFICCRLSLLTTDILCRTVPLRPKLISSTLLENLKVLLCIIVCFTFKCFDNNKYSELQRILIYEQVGRWCAYFMFLFLTARSLKQIAK
jgi:hypothetical protein